MKQPNFKKDRKKYFHTMNPSREFVNLKELRDQILRRRCSNGKLFMYGVANEGRLGVSLPDIEKKEASSMDKEGEWTMETKGL